MTHKKRKYWEISRFEQPNVLTGGQNAFFFQKFFLDVYNDADRHRFDADPNPDSNQDPSSFTHGGK
jgi:hypothetical protein